MKQRLLKPISLLLLCCSLLYSLQSIAQKSTAHRKSSNAYRNNYQRVFTSSESNSSFEIRANGTLWAWGANNYGQLGDGTLIRKSSPVPIGTDSWVVIASCFGHTMGIKANGTLWAWGYNNVGQLGDGTYVDKITPIQIGADDKWISVVVGQNHTVALKADGTLWTWGDNANGKLGDGTTVDKGVPTLIGSDNKWTSISASRQNTYAIKSDGSLWAWGSNFSGQIGDGTSGAANTRLSPTKIGIDKKWTDITASEEKAMALKSDGTMWAWGNNTYGQLGDGTTTNRSIPTQLGIGFTWVNIAMGFDNTYAIRSDGTLWGWGRNDMRSLGIGSNTNQQNNPVQLGLDSNWTNVSAANAYGFATKTDGTLWAWGHNDFGQLGVGNTSDAFSPIITSVKQKGILSLSVAQTHTVAVNLDGTLWTWGSNSDGQLGDASTTSKSSPVKVGNDSTWVSAVAGYDFTLALKNNGSLWAWGRNTFGQIGDGTLTSKNIPIRVGTDNNWTTISAGGYHCLALKSDGTLWAWGANSQFQIGDATQTNRYSPVQIGTSTDWASVSAGTQHSLALKADGTAWSWGDAAFGQLGTSTTTDRTTPTKFTTDSIFISLVAGASHSLALKSNGTLFAFGLNSGAQLGDGTTTNKLTITPIGTGTKWVGISAGESTSFGIHSDGTYWAWGLNANGEFGNGTTTVAGSPSQVTSQSKIVGLHIGGSGSNRHSGIIKADRSATCLSGYNANGQLGNTTTTNTTNFTCNTVLPVLIGSFSAQKQNNTVVLNWTTAQEINTHYFNIERSVDGVNFTIAGKTIAMGVGNNSYAFTDDIRNINASKIYYRLQNVDKDSRFTYSQIIAIHLQKNNTGLSVYPNPIKGNQFMVDAGIIITTPIVYTIYNTLGKAIQQGALSQQVQLISINNASAGIYLLQLANGQKTKLIKL